MTLAPEPFELVSLLRREPLREAPHARPHSDEVARGLEDVPDARLPV
jgi:hypothetical protein